MEKNIIGASIRDAITDLNEIEQKAFFIWCDHKGHDLNEEYTDQLKQQFEDEYCGQWQDKEDYARDLLDSCYSFDDMTKLYFNYEAFTRDLFINDNWFDDGFVFTNY